MSFIAFLVFGATITIVSIAVACGLGWVLQLLLPVSFFQGCLVSMGGVVVTALVASRLFEAVERDVLWEKVLLLRDREAGDEDEEDDNAPENEEEKDGRPVKVTSPVQDKKRKKRR